jgi:hypothetical protein
LFFFVSPVDQYGFYRLGVSVTLAVICCGLGCFSWLRSETGSVMAGLAGAVLYMAMPYYLAAVIYLRGAFAEVWAFVWLPMLLVFVRKTVVGSSTFAIGLSVTYAALIMTHLPTVLLFSPVPILYALAISRSDRRLRNLLLISGAMALGVALASIYLVPAMMMQEFVSMHQRHDVFLSTGNWFISLATVTQGFRLTIPLASLLSLMAGICFFFVGRNRDQHYHRQRHFWLGLSLFSFFMMTSPSMPIWQLFPILQEVQFPTRYNVILSIAVAALAAFGVKSFGQLSPRRKMFVRGIAAVLILLWAAFDAANIIRSTPILASSDENDAKMIGPLVRKKDAPEYRPIWAPNDDEAIISEIEHETNVLKVDTLAGDAELRAVQMRPRLMVIDFAAQHDSTLRLHQFYFPGWKARIGDQEVRLLPDAADGTINVRVPPGENRLEVELTRTSYELIGLFMSSISLAVLLTFGIVAVRRTHRPG